MRSVLLICSLEHEGTSPRDTAAHMHRHNHMQTHNYKRKHTHNTRSSSKASNGRFQRLLPLSCKRLSPCVVKSPHIPHSHSSISSSRSSSKHNQQCNNSMCLWYRCRLKW